MFIVSDAQKAYIPGKGERQAWDLKDDATGVMINRIEHKSLYITPAEDGRSLTFHEMHPVDRNRYPNADFMVSIGTLQQYHPDFQLLPARRKPKSKYILLVGHVDPSITKTEEIRVSVDLNTL